MPISNLETARKANIAVLHTAATSLPVPAGFSAGAAIFTVSPASSSILNTERVAVNLRGDLAVDASVPLTVTGPVHLWGLMNGVWRKVELLEATSMDLTEGPSSYRIKLSPWFERLAIAAPSWVPGVGENVTVRMFRWWS